MNTIRYFVALVLVVGLPPLFLYWLLIHPLINFWRSKGIGLTYGIVLIISLATMIGLFSIRHDLLVVDFGTSYSFIIIGVVCLILAGIMRLALHKHVTISTLIGLPEIAPERYFRTLITEGIYSRIRHPRYVQLLIALTGYALIANHLASYIAVALWLPGVYVIALLEEKELRDHFGQAYDEYCRKVPRFMPRLLHDSKDATKIGR